jgi:hypothetical protein
MLENRDASKTGLALVQSCSSLRSSTHGAVEVRGFDIDMVVA